MSNLAFFSTEFQGIKNHNVYIEVPKILCANYRVTDDIIFPQTFENCFTDFLFMRKQLLLRITIHCKSADISSASVVDYN